MYFKRITFKSRDTALLDINLTYYNDNADSLECLRLPPLVLALPALVVAEAAPGSGHRLQQGHGPVHPVHTSPDPLTL